MNQQTVILEVEGMSCQHCVNSIQKAVGGLKGVSRVAVDLHTKQVTVELDSQAVNLQDLKTVIEDQGYEVKL